MNDLRKYLYLESLAKDKKKTKCVENKGDKMNQPAEIYRAILVFDPLTNSMTVSVLDQSIGQNLMQGYGPGKYEEAFAAMEQYFLDAILNMEAWKKAGMTGELTK